MFENFSTKSLLSSCSLVNKTWNRVAQTFIRDHRKCLAVFPPDQIPLICPLLRGLRNLFRDRADNNVVVPVNSLKIDIGGIFQECRPYELCPVSLPTAMKLLFLELRFWPGQTRRCFHRPIENLFRHHSQNLRCLTIDYSFECLEAIFAGFNPSFPALEQITLNFRPSASKKDLSAETSILERILDSAANLKEIYPIPRGNLILAIIPEDKYNLLARLDLRFFNSEKDEILFLKVAERCVNLKELSVFTPENQWAASEQDDYVRNCGKFNSVLKQLLQSCHKSLKSISVEGFYLPDFFSPPVLQSVSKMAMSLDHFELTTAESWLSISSIDLNRKFPSLKEVQIHFVDVVQDDGLLEWPHESIDQAVTSGGCASGVRKLTLELQVQKVNIAHIQRIFPSISELKLTLHRTLLVGDDVLPISDICEYYWRQLEKLTVTGDRTGWPCNYDASFLGIHKEEVEELRGMDQDFLRAVNIVPIQRCLFAMPSKCRK